MISDDPTTLQPTESALAMPMRVDVPIADRELGEAKQNIYSTMSPHRPPCGHGAMAIEHVIRQT
jgi:hypothetical protein